MRPQGPQDSRNGLKKACRQTLKDLLVYTAAKNGLVLIGDVKLLEQMKEKNMLKQNNKKKCKNIYFICSSSA